MADPADKPDYANRPGPPPEASRYLRNKSVRPSFSWQDVEPEEHAVAFSVAKMAQRDMLEAARGEIQKALDEGLPFAAFKKSWEANEKLSDWRGYGEARDPLKGGVKPAELGTPRRLRTIYRANLRSARAAGQWERIERTKDALPYLEYRLGPSERHRPHHQSKEGLVLPVSASFWDSWMPPNGWGCKCWVRQISRRQAEALGIDEPPEVPDRDWTNRRTGEVKRVPQGIDPGWERNPGKLRLRSVEDMLIGRLASAPVEVARAATLDIATSWRAERVLAGQAGGSVPVAVLPVEIAEGLDIATPIVRMTSEYGNKFITRGRTVTTTELRLLDEALRTGVVVREKTGGGAALVIESLGPKPWRFVIKILAEADELWLTSAYRSQPRKRRALLGRQTVDRILRE